MEQSRVEVESILGSVEQYFGPLARRNARGSEAVGLLPSEFGAIDEYVSFVKAANGYTVTIEDDVAGRLFSVQESLSCYPVSSRLRRVLPIRGDGCGDYECVVGAGIAAGAVVFWDHEVDLPLELIAGSFSSYLKFWAESLRGQFEQSGRTRGLGIREGWPWPFDRSYMTARDERLAELLADRWVQEWLCTGDPFHGRGRETPIDKLWSDWMELKEAGFPEGLAKLRMSDGSAWGNQWAIAAGCVEGIAGCGDTSEFHLRILPKQRELIGSHLDELNEEQKRYFKRFLELVDRAIEIVRAKGST